MQEKETRSSSSQTLEPPKLRIEGLAEALRSERVRWLIAREQELKKDSNMNDQSFNNLLKNTIEEETERSMILSELKKRKEGTVGEVASATKIPPKIIVKHMIALMKRGAISVSGEKQDEYSFTVLEQP
jgi:DNA-binding transcriptional ArsR family regulator